MIYTRMDGIRHYREASGLTVAEAAAEINVTKQTWYDWERGKYVPSAAYLPAMAELLHCEITDLYKVPTWQ